ncbi:uncharacterized protein LOC134258895 [Saccostrea cucullata]|uniref:uncharacterized protein LOC134258895 n=1 Tax=Saccostrea cuccullata TaxID=36930 RepID=UPI002ED1108A
MSGVLGSLCILAAIAGCLGIDLTLQPGGFGSGVVESVVSRIRESCLFADDKRFLRRLAYVQSRDGTDPKTYGRSNYHGGIWQVDESKFRQTQTSSSLQAQRNIILNKFGIDWSNVAWQDLRKPLYSGIAAALYTILHGGVSWRIEDQANTYENYFHSFGGNNFTVQAQLLDQGCHGNEALELVLLVDSSNSLSQDDFTRAKLFMNQIVDSFNIASDKTRVSVVTYSNNPHIEFYLNSYTSKSPLKSAIQNLPFRPGSTNTAGALQTAVSNVFTGSRPNAAKVLIVITDGQSNDMLNTQHAADNAKNNGIIMFSVGVGSRIDHSELNYMATTPSCTHVFTVSGYDEIKALKEELIQSSCRAPVYINSTFSCVFEKCPPLAVLTSTPGVTIETNVTCGNGNIYTAFNSPYPGPSYYQTLNSVSSGNPTSVFHNASGDQTLFINLVDALKNQISSSAGCVITITPYHGDHTDHTMKCYIDGIKIECPDNCKEKWNFPNPCTPENIAEGLLQFAHPTDSTKYLMCNQIGKLYIVQCPQYESYYQSCQQCVGNFTSCVTGNKTNVDSSSSPCTLANLQAGKFFFVYPSDNTKFIHCDVWGKAWALSCPGGEIWDQSILTCIPLDSVGQSSTSSPSIIKPGVSHQYGGDEVNGYLCCPTCPRFSPPCTHSKINSGRLFHAIAGDRHHYIQCDLTGRMYCPMSCAPEADGSLDFFNYQTQTCVDGSLLGVVG